MKKIIIFLTIMILASCVIVNYPQVFESVLQAAGENAVEIKKSIYYFQNKGEYLQLNSLYSLLENINGHSYYEFGLFDSENSQLDWDIADYSSYEEATNALDSLETTLGNLHWDEAKKVEDVKVITSQYLINNVELAYQVWKNKPWSQSYPFPTFKEYILPYRANNEPLGKWRQFFLKQFQGLEQKMEDPTDAVEAATLINKTLQSWFQFDPKYYLHPTDQGFMQMLRSGQGRCEDMTTYAIYAMRANGIPVTTDYTPYWADANNNHAWNAVINKKGETIPFMGCETDPGEYELGHKIAKVYRKSYQKQPQNLIFQEKNKDLIPPWLGSKFSRDVTPFYTKVNDIVIEPDTIKYMQPDSTNYLFLATFNDGEWHPIDWAKLEENAAEFIDMGLGILYLPCYYNQKVIPAGSAFILQETGKLHYLNGSKSEEPFTLQFASSRRAVVQARSDSLQFNDASGEYELFYWKDKWISLGKKTTKNKLLQYENIPANRIYRLTKTEGPEKERIFSFENEKQIWW